MLSQQHSFMATSVSSSLCCSAGGIPGAAMAHHLPEGKDQTEGRKESKIPLRRVVC